MGGALKYGQSDREALAYRKQKRRRHRKLTELDFMSIILLLLAIGLSVCVFLILHGMSKILKKLEADIKRMKGEKETT